LFDLSGLSKVAQLLQIPLHPTCARSEGPSPHPYFLHCCHFIFDVPQLDATFFDLPICAIPSSFGSAFHSLYFDHPRASSTLLELARFFPTFSMFVNFVIRAIYLVCSDGSYQKLR
jgi:hypothetical protein